MIGAPTSAVVFERLARVPFVEQCALIDHELARDRALSELLDALAGLRDHEPLAYAVARLAKRRLLERPDIARALGRAFSVLPDTGIQRILGCTTSEWPEEQLTVLIECAAAAVRAFTIERVAAICLLDRWLENHAPAVRRALIDEAAVELRKALSLTHERELDARTCQLLLRVPGTRIASLTAECPDSRARATLSDWLGTFAAKILDILEHAPKSLSQANAEDILARRVYTDPGHFLAELLQNAEDAGARVFRVEFASHTITVWHDGAAFDAKDVVGVLSIGQTTKHKEQIGFFGVGFKSVYEVCVRPQVYSGPFCFEIAEVSIPRQLDRPADMDSGTRLVLSLREPEHALRGSRALFARALELPAEILLTLSNLERIEIRCGAEYRIMSAAIADADWSGQHDGQTQAPDALRVERVHLTQRQRLRASTTGNEAGDLAEEATLERAYLVASGRFSCTDMARERARATKTRLLTAVALDARGLPTPLERDTPTVFSFLPTRERSGLQFLVHAHFDVPVDRERLDLESAWNRWALARAGQLLAGFVARAADRGRARESAGDGREFLDCLLDVLPVAEELMHPTYRVLLAELAAHARDIAFLRGADGRRIAPACAALAEDRSLLAVLAGIDVTVTGAGVYLCDVAPADARGDRTHESSVRARRERVATTLGARGFAGEDLVALLERVLTPIADGSACGLPWLTPQSLRALYDALARAPAGRVREAHEQRLRALPLFLDEHGRQRLVGSIRRADSPALRTLYSHIQPLLHPDLDESSDSASIDAPARAAWYRRMGLYTLSDADLLADLRVPERAHALVTRTRWDLLFEHLASLPAGTLAGLGDCAIFHTTRPVSVDEIPSIVTPGREPWLLAPLANARDIAWLSDLGPVANVLACLRGPRPALVLPDLQARHAGLLQRLGARVLDLAALLELSRDPRALRIEHASEARALHQAVDTMRSELSPRLAHELAATHLFPDRAGTLRPLVGQDCALMAWDVGDEELIALFAEAPWLDPTIAELAYVHTLGVPEVGPGAVARALVAASLSAGSAEASASAGAHERALQHALGQGEPWYAPARLRALYGYLSRAHGVLSADIREQLARAPIWLADAEETETHERHPLDALRLPARAPEVAAVYRDWPEFPVIDVGQADAPDEEHAPAPCSALELARALALEHRLKSPDHETAIRDLVEVSRHASGARVPAAWSALVACVGACARELPHKKLAPIVHAHIFAAHGRPSSERYPLVDWQTGLEHVGVARAHAPERDALIHGSRLVLDEHCEADLRPALDALGIQPAGPGDVIAALQRDPLLAGQDAHTRARAALAAAVQRHGPAILDARARDTLAALPLWPTVDGRMLPAGAVARSQDIGRSVTAEQDFWAQAEALFRDALAHLDADNANASADVSAGALLAADAEDHAEALACVLEFRDPLAALTQAVTHAARVNQPLEVQPELLRAPERVAEIFCALIGRAEPTRAASEPPLPWQLPLVVNAAGNLVSGPCYLATDAMCRIARHLPLHDELAHPAWAAVIERRAGKVLAHVGPRRFLAVLADAGREPWRLGERPHLSDAETRQALYDWLLEMRAHIAEDVQARGLLGRACVIATRAGYIRAPRDLLLDPELPDLGIDWNAHDEVPAELSAWLRATFAMDEKRLAPLVEHLLGAHEQAVRAGDGARSAKILRFLARSLRVDRAPSQDADAEVAALVKRFKLRKRLRVEDSRGEFTRPRALLAPEPGRWRQLHEFAEQLPARVSARYEDPAVLCLLQWAGADADIASARLTDYLAGEHRRSGLHADLALARYLAERGHREPALRQELGLRERAFIPDRLGHLRAAGELYWPEGDAAEVVGDRPSCFPHPGFFHAVPPDIDAWLPFRRAENATLADVVAHVRERADRGQPAPEAVLAWLDSQLRAGRVVARAVYQALAEVPFLVDDDGHIRPPRELSREHPGWLFGQRRGGYSAARAYSRLCAALKLPKTPGKREILDVCADVLDDLERLGSAQVLAREPDLLERLGRCLEKLADAGGPLPERLPAPVEDTRGEPGLCPAPRPGVLFLRRPAELWQSALAGQAEILVPLLVHPEDTRVEDVLERVGVPPLTHASADVLPAAAGYRAAEESARQAAPRTPEPRPPGAGDPEEDTRQVRRRRERAARREREREQRRESARTPADQAGEQDRDHRPEPRRQRERTASDDDTRDERGLLTRIRHWLRGQEQDAADRHRPEQSRPRPSRPDTDTDTDAGRDAGLPPPTKEREYRPPGASRGGREDSRASLPDHSQWFRPRRRLGPQLGDNTAWAEDRAHIPVFGLAFAPRSLPAPHVYAAHTIWDRYDPGAQRFTRTALPAEWSRPAAPGSYRVHLRGRLPAGEVVLPVPAYGRVVELTTTPAGGDLIDGPEGAHVLYSEAECDISYTVTLDQAPDFERARTSESDPGQARHLLAPTTADSELPAEVLETVDLIQDTHARALDRALAVRAFIRERYYYDAAYLEDPELGRWLARVTRGRGNPHIAAMHAGRDASYLGRGVCYELNSLCCELLRRVGIPAAVATGWTLDRGALDEPDHMWAMALLPSPSGPRWLPLDASTTRDGTPLHAGRRPPGPWRARGHEQRQRPPRPPAWDRRQVRTHERGEVHGAPLSDLLRVVRWLEEQAGKPPEGPAALRRRCRALLDDSEASERLLRALFGDSDP